ncbi:MAG: S-adenosylmethionine decarboxylase [Candidatus Moraniibacteriota bacterium]
MKARLWRDQFFIRETDPAALKQFFDKLLLEAGLSVVGFTDKHFEPQGYTAVWVLSESHFAVHTFPEQQETSCELSCCNLEKYNRFLELVDFYTI